MNVETFSEWSHMSHSERASTIMSRKILSGKQEKITTVLKSWKLKNVIKKTTTNLGCQLIL